MFDGNESKYIIRDAFKRSPPINIQKKEIKNYNSEGNIVYLPKLRTLEDLDEQNRGAQRIRIL